MNLLALKEAVPARADEQKPVNPRKIKVFLGSCQAGKHVGNSAQPPVLFPLAP
jgi:hypothetical protein